MGIKGRLTRLEKAAEERFTTIACSECGEKFRVGGDLALDVLAASWTRETGIGPDEPPVVSLILNHPHEGLIEALTRDELPGAVVHA